MDAGKEKSAYERQKLAYERAIDRPTATLDVNPVIVTDDKKFVLAKRIPTVQEGGKWSFPGGKIFVGERIEESLRRMTRLKTGLEIQLMFPSLSESLVGIYDDPKRDPRAHVIGFAFFCKIIGGKMKPGGNSEKVDFFSPEQIEDLDLAFDHRIIFEDALRILKQRGKI